MEPITLILIIWAVSRAWQQAKGGWRATRDLHANQLRGAHPTWSTRRVQRAAGRRAGLWWGHELRNGLPTIRGSLAEDWDHIRSMRAEEQLAGERRRDVLRKELEDRRQAREDYGRAIESGGTDLGFGEWLDSGRPGVPAAPAPAAGTATTGTTPGATTGTTAPGTTAPGPGTTPGPGTAPGTAAPTGPAPGPGEAAGTPDGRHLRAVPDPDPGDTAGSAGGAGDGTAADTAPATDAGTAPVSPATPAAVATPTGHAPDPDAGTALTDDDGPASAGTAANTAPASPGRADSTDNGGTDMTMEAPNIEAARTVARTLAAGLRGSATDAEQFENDLIAGGMNKDQSTMAAVRHAMEQLALAAAAWDQVITELSKHAQGEEYAATGVAAKTEFLQPS